MKTPHAILIGLVLIAAAIFFKGSIIDPAESAMLSGADDMKCFRIAKGPIHRHMLQCLVLHGPNVTTFVTDWSGDLGRTDTSRFTGTWRKTMAASPSE